MDVVVRLDGEILTPLLCVDSKDMDRTTTACILDPNLKMQLDSLRRLVWTPLCALVDKLYILERDAKTLSQYESTQVDGNFNSLVNAFFANYSVVVSSLEELFKLLSQ